MAAVVPVLVGTAVAQAEGRFDPWAALAALLGAGGIQVGTNLANDLFDWQQGADTSARLGPPRAMASGLLSARAMKLGITAAYLFATLNGLYLQQVAGPVAVYIGLASMAAGLWYTWGRWSLAYLGLGDLFVLLFFGGVAVAGTTRVQAGYVPLTALFAAVPVGALATVLLVVNNVRDEETDRAARKRTLVVRLGRRFALTEAALLLVASYAVPVVLFARGGHPLVLAPLATTPLALLLFRGLRRNTGRALNQTLGHAARLLLLFGALFALGLAHGTGR